MTDNSGTDNAQDFFSMEWGKMMSEQWSALFNTWGGMFMNYGAEDLWKSKGRASESMQAGVKMVQAMMGSMGDPMVMEHFQKATQMTPDILFGLTNTCVQSITDLQGQVGEWLQKRGSSISTADIQELDRDLIRKWNETYEKEFSQFLKIPQIGLGRFYQERSLNAADKLTAFQSVFAEFAHMLYLPVEESFRSLQNKVVEMSEAGAMDDKSKTYYNLWIKLLEGHYMEMFKRPDYAKMLSKTLGALNEFVKARQAAVNDILKQLNIPTHKDLDDLYKEIYLLKKRLRAAENKSK